MTINRIGRIGAVVPSLAINRLLRSATTYFLWLPIGGLLALAWANVAPEGYFTVAHRLAFAVNDVGMALFFALITQEIVEAVVPRGLLHSWRRWMFPIVAAAGAFAGAAGIYLAYVATHYEMVLWQGWPVATAIDLAFVYMLVRAVFGRHPAGPFALVVAVATNVVGYAIVAVREPFIDLRLGPVVFLVAALAIAATLRSLRVRSVWLYLLVPGPIAWWALFAMGLNPALALVPIVPFMRHSARHEALFTDAPHTVHGSAAHLEHTIKYPVHAVLFLFGLVNAGVVLSGYGTGTWAILLASLVGRPVGLLLGASAGLLVGLHWPRGLHWRDLAVVSMATSGGFATALFFATAIYPAGPIRGELKLGVIASGIGAVVTLLLAWWSEPRGACIRVRRSRPEHHTVA
jgi:Na+:H+ antiporter, NhaA family